MHRHRNSQAPSMSDRNGWRESHDAPLSVLSSAQEEAKLGADDKCRWGTAFSRHGKACDWGMADGQHKAGSSYLHSHSLTWPCQQQTSLCIIVNSLAPSLGLRVIVYTLLWQPPQEIRIDKILLLLVAQFHLMLSQTNYNWALKSQNYHWYSMALFYFFLIL